MAPGTGSAAGLYTYLLAVARHLVNQLTELPVGTALPNLEVDHGDDGAPLPAEGEVSAEFN